MEDIQKIEEIKFEDIPCDELGNNEDCDGKTYHLLTPLECNDPTSNVSVNTSFGDRREFQFNKNIMRTSYPDETVSEVIYHMYKGCTCRRGNCYLGLNSQSVYEHRLKMADMEDDERNSLLLESIKLKYTLRSKKNVYFFNGIRVCRNAFLYLQNCTTYRLKNLTQILVENKENDNNRKLHKIRYNYASNKRLKQIKPAIANFHARRSDEKVLINTEKEYVTLPLDMDLSNFYNAYNIVNSEGQTIGYYLNGDCNKEEIPQKNNKVQQVKHFVVNKFHKLVPIESFPNYSVIIKPIFLNPISNNNVEDSNNNNNLFVVHTNYVITNGGDVISTLQCN